MSIPVRTTTIPGMRTTPSSLRGVRGTPYLKTGKQVRSEIKMTPALLLAQREAIARRAPWHEKEEVGKLGSIACAQLPGR